ncbi:hypothetical protein [Thermoplasma sp.]|uniref:hypothetical protein n=1 Tax=Thermoplasma sp. TaxID=1973142 RepID=UPI00260FDE5C|nr:hypothetical protein [Thermoplasma sp.]
MAVEGRLIDVSKATMTNSTLRVSITKRIAEILDVKEGDIIGYYQKDDKIYLGVIR